MNEKFEKLFELFDTVTLDLIVDIAIDNSWGRSWTDQTRRRFQNMQDQGERMLQEAASHDEYSEKLNKILNDMDSLWNEGKTKGLVK